MIMASLCRCGASGAEGRLSYTDNSARAARHCVGQVILPHHGFFAFIAQVLVEVCLAVSITRDAPCAETVNCVTHFLS